MWIRSRMRRLGRFGRKGGCRLVRGEGKGLGCSYGAGS